MTSQWQFRGEPIAHRPHELIKQDEIREREVDAQGSERREGKSRKMRDRVE